MISNQCHQCGKKLVVNDDRVGKNCKCPECQTIVPIPASGEADNVYSSDADLPKMSTITHDHDLPQSDAKSPPSDGETLHGPSGTADIPGYEITSELGHGNMGVIYKARHLKLKRIVALKMILSAGHASSEDIKRFLTEAEAVAAFSHPNIVQVHDVGQHHKLPYMALEFVSGGNLAGRLSGKPLPPKHAAGLVEQMARGMNAAHQAGIVHRDLKPANVLLTEHGAAKITDFGLAKRVEGGSGLTHTGAIMGTPSYMAPEQAGGEGKRVGPAADVYALGAILYACLTGRPPFKAANIMETLRQVINQEPMPPRQLNKRVPNDLDTICLKCLEKDALKRYASANDLAEDLRCWQAGEPITARPVGQFERAVKWVKRRPVVAGLMAAVVLLAIIGTTVSTYFGVEASKRAEETLRALNKAETARAQAEREKKQKEKQLLRAESLLYISQITEAHNHFQNYDFIRCRRSLNETRWDLRGPEYGYLCNQLEKKSAPFSLKKNPPHSQPYGFCS